MIEPGRLVLHGMDRTSGTGVVAQRKNRIGIVGQIAQQVRRGAGRDPGHVDALVSLGVVAQQHGRLMVERMRYRPVRSGDRTFVFERSIELTEAHAGDDPAAVVSERAELLRHTAAIDTERERVAFQERADAVTWTALAEGDHRERTQEQAAAARALSEQINANLREPPLTE